MQLGYRQPRLIVNVYNGGDVRTGVRIEFQALGDVVNPIIDNVDSQEFIRLNITLQDGDVLTLSTGYGDKWAKLYRDGVTTDALRYKSLSVCGMKAETFLNSLADLDGLITDFNYSIWYTMVYRVTVERGNHLTFMLYNGIKVEAPQPLNEG